MRQAFSILYDDFLEHSEQEGMWENRKLKDVADLSFSSTFMFSLIHFCLSKVYVYLTELPSF